MWPSPPRFFCPSRCVPPLFFRPDRPNKRGRPDRRDRPDRPAALASCPSPEPDRPDKRDRPDRPERPDLRMIAEEKTRGGGKVRRRQGRLLILRLLLLLGWLLRRCFLLCHENSTPLRWLTVIVAPWYSRDRVTCKSFLFRVE